MITELFYLSLYCVISGWVFGVLTAYAVCYLTKRKPRSRK